MSLNTKLKLHLKLCLFQYQFSASFLEIYNERIRDLLGEGKDDVKHEIKLVSPDSEDVKVTNLTTVPVPGADKVKKY